MKDQILEHKTRVNKQKEQAKKSKLRLERDKASSYYIKLKKMKAKILKLGEKREAQNYSQPQIIYVPTPSNYHHSQQFTPAAKDLPPQQQPQQQFQPYFQPLYTPQHQSMYPQNPFPAHQPHQHPSMAGQNAERPNNKSVGESKKF